MNKTVIKITQKVMKIGMYLIPWSMPATIEGAGSIKQLPSLIKEKGFHKVLIVTGKNIKKFHLLDPLFQKLDEENISYVCFAEVSSNPTDCDVEKGVRLYNENHCEAMIAIGGGSPMDCAKGIGACLARPNKSIDQLQGVLRVMKKIPVIFAVPTTAGTRSETTIAAVITDSKTHRKASINDICIIPKYAILDPELTVGLPPNVTAMTGLDALCHAVEAYTNNTYNTRVEKE